MTAARPLGRAGSHAPASRTPVEADAGGRLELVVSGHPDDGEPATASHNLAGQRLGRKGRETRERIITAMLHLCEEEPDVAVTLTNVARRADVRLSALYLYFPDLEALLLAGLERVTAAADTYIDLLRHRWPDQELGQACLDLTRAYHRFWKRHTRILHLRNTLSETDSRLRGYRRRTSQPLRILMLMQMDASDRPTAAVNATATVMVMGLERLATVVTDADFGSVTQRHDKREEEALIDSLLQAEARVLQLAIADQRVAAAVPLHATRQR